MNERSFRLGFVMGLGRSGTTFLAKLIDSSPNVLYRHEPDAVLPTDMPSLICRKDLEHHLPKARAYVEAMAACRRVRANGHLPVFSKAFRSRVGNLAFRPMVLSTKLARNLRLSLPDRMPDLINGEHGDMLCLIKSVSALGRARLFAEAHPAMVSIHILRHPCAVIASARVGIEKGVMGAKVFLNALFAQEESANYPYSFADLENASYEEQAAYRWMLMNDKAASDMAGAPGYLRIRYEDLCTEVDRVSRQIFDHLGLAFDAQTARFIRDISRLPEDGTAETGYFRIKRPILSGIDKWKTQMRADDVARIRDVVSHSPLGRAYFADDAASARAAPPS
ncbi:MAG: sulfotransferase [Alphaproteobacteria bacterium]